jgi:hypothetical protein
MKFRVLRPGLAVLALLLATSSSRASIVIGLQEAGVNGGAITTVATGADFTSASFTGTYGDFHVQVVGGASDNGADLSDLLSSTTSVTNTSSGEHTLHIYVSQTDYTLPASTILAVESGMSGTVNSGTVNLNNIFQAFADAGNNQYGTGDFSNGLQSAVASGSTFDTGSAFGKFTRNGNYSMTTEVNFDLSGGGKANYSDHVNVTPTPAPAGVVLALTGLPVLGVGGWLRRRKQA